MDEARLEHLLHLDLSAGTEEFRDELLERCLDVLDSGAVAEIADENLDLLAAAGDPTSVEPDARFGDNKPEIS